MIYYDLINDFCNENHIDFNKDMYEKLLIYMELLIDNNKKFNLTSVDDKEGIIRRHFIDSLTILKHNLKPNCALCDVGTGAGFPGLPVKIVRDDISLTLVEATNKKTNFLKEVIKEFSLNNIKVINDRGENLSRDSSHREKYDYVTSRAMARLNKLLEISFPLVKVNGEFIALKGIKANEEIEEFKKGLKILGGEIKNIISYNEGNIIIIKKTNKTPNIYPRNYNLILKKPL